MSLDVFAYRNISVVTNDNVLDESDSDLECVYFTLYFNPYFKGSVVEEDNLREGVVYKAESAFDFSVGTYSGYNTWRENLAILAGHRSDKNVWNNPKSGPFVELINFSDCEGTIGTTVSSKLATDFAEFQSKVDKLHVEDFRELYSLFRQAFEFASNDGAVIFR